MKGLFILLFSLFMLSCEEQKYVITEVGDFRVRSGVSNDNKITAQFRLEVYFKTMLLANNWNLLPTANAFQKGPIYYVNAINLKSIKVSIDRDVRTIDDELIKPGDNLPGYRIAGEHDYFSIDNEIFLRSNVLMIYFDLYELQKLKFEKGLTKITLTGKNTDNIQFKFEKEVYFDL